ncbi:DUF485 domain-containing protein [Saccharopolyspora erythraea]|uniref:DUF485 domain-containing protein n=1 Tax=Saccharopolyspora erythraea TaxID=1836 RepID=UPI001BA44A54|nr:DUF485 domain-containing protein [Saccharopolyspora erythraea]QUH00022.1 DUF485 domain-containing protein [Saccharopolyspora erythraea]
MTNATQSALRGQPRDQAGKGRTAFGGIDKSSVRPTHQGPDFAAIHDSAEFRHLRSRVKWFVFPMTAFFIVWYLGYVVLAAYLPEFMATRLWGEVNVGLVMGVGQFATTLIITGMYVRFARKHMDPEVEEIRREAIGDER